MPGRFIVIAAAMVIAGCGKGSTAMAPSTTATSASSVSIVAGSRLLTTNAYNPNPINITRGMSVNWVNNDTIAHTTTSDAGVWDSRLLGPGQSFSMTFPNAGTFAYHCSVHPNMVGTVNVQ